MREWERKEGKTTAGSRCPRRAARPAPASSSAPRGGIRAGSPLHKAAARPALPIPSQGAMQAVPRRGGSLEGAPCPREAGEQVSCAGRASRAALGRRSERGRGRPLLLEETGERQTRRNGSAVRHVEEKIKRATKNSWAKAWVSCQNKTAKIFGAAEKTRL